MTDLNRRGLLFGLGAALIAAPAIVRASSLMSVKPLDLTWSHAIRTDVFRGGVRSSITITGLDELGRVIRETVYLSLSPLPATVVTQARFKSFGTVHFNPPL